MPHIGPITDKMFVRYMQRWQNRQQPVGPTPSTGQTGSSGHTTSNKQISSTSTQPNFLVSLEKLLAECKNDLAKMIKENLEIDVRGKTQCYQKSYPISFDTVTYPAGFRLP